MKLKVKNLVLIVRWLMRNYKLVSTFVIILIATMSVLLNNCANPATEDIVKNLEYDKLNMITENPNLEPKLKTKILKAMKDGSDDTGDLLYKYRKELVINNATLDNDSKSWWLIIIMQFKDYSTKEIADGLYLWEHYGDIIVSDELLEKAQSRRDK